MVYIAALQVTRVHDLSGHRPVAKEGLCLFVFCKKWMISQERNGRLVGYGW